MNEFTPPTLWCGSPQFLAEDGNWTHAYIERISRMVLPLFTLHPHPRYTRYTLDTLHPIHAAPFTPYTLHPHPLYTLHPYRGNSRP